MMKLDSHQASELEAHLHECDGCRAVLEREGQLRLAVRKAAEADRAPDSLRSKVVKVCEREKRRNKMVQRTWPAVSAAAVLASLIWQGATGEVAAQDLEEAAVRHARNLPMDVIAGDVVHVEQYFDGKLPFAVHVLDVVRNQPISVQLGGRVINLSNQEAAYVRYDLPGGRVSMFVYPEASHRPERSRAWVSDGRAAYLVPTGARLHDGAVAVAGGLVYSLVTDLPERELTKCADGEFALVVVLVDDFVG